MPYINMGKRSEPYSGLHAFDKKNPFLGKPPGSWDANLASDPDNPLDNTIFVQPTPSIPPFLLFAALILIANNL